MGPGRGFSTQGARPATRTRVASQPRPARRDGGVRAASTCRRSLAARHALVSLLRSSAPVDAPSPPRACTRRPRAAPPSPWSMDFSSGARACRRFETVLAASRMMHHPRRITSSRLSRVAAHAIGLVCVASVCVTPALSLSSGLSNTNAPSGFRGLSETEISPEETGEAPFGATCAALSSVARAAARSCRGDSGLGSAWLGLTRAARLGLA